MIEIYINGEQITCESNIQLQEEFMNPSNIILSKCYPLSWKGTNKLLTDYYYPEDYSKCTIYKDKELYFVGIVKNSADMTLNPFRPHYCSLQILDPSTLLSEGDTLDFVVTEKTITEAINQVVNEISSYGFVVGNILIPNDVVIGNYSTYEKTPYDVFNYFSLVSGTRWGTRMIDENTTAIDFFSPELLDNLGTIECSKEFYLKNKIDDISYDYSTTDYRNKQIILSDEVFGNIEYSDVITSNGYDKNFIITSKIAKVNSILINGENVDFSTKAEKEAGITAEFYYEPGNNNIESDSVYIAGTVIEIKYIPLIEGRQVITNNTEIRRIKNQINRNGIISRYEKRNDTTSSTELQSIGETYIKYKGVAEVSLTITSEKDFLIIGGKYFFNAPIKKLEGDYLVKSKKTNIIYAGNLIKVTYEYILSNSFDTENELNYFDNQRNKVNGNISSGEFITRNIDIEMISNIIWENCAIREFDFDDDNVLNTSLDSPFVQ